MSGRRLTAKSILLIFALCAVFDFVWGYSKEHSVLAGVIFVVLGLPFTGLLFLFLGHFRKGKG
jgi:hypothetical protein